MKKKKRRQKPFSPSCEENKDDILKVLKQVIAPENSKVVEIASGTGQHAIFFAPHFQHLQWVTTDVADKLPGIRMWLDEARVPNIIGPLEYEVGKDEFPIKQCDVVFAANIFHMLPWKKDKTLIKDLGNRLRKGAKAIFYGAFNYGGKFTSQSNEDFDKKIKEEDPQRGIRNFEDVHRAMIKAGFELTKDFEMPYDNRILYFTRLEHVKPFTSGPEGGPINPETRFYAKR